MARFGRLRRRGGSDTSERSDRTDRPGRSATPGRSEGSEPKTAPHRKFRSRAARVRRRPWLLAAIVAGLIGVVGGLVYLVGYSSVLAVEQVRAESSGDDPLPEGLQEEVLQLAQVPSGAPLIRVDTGAAAERVLSDLRVEEVSVRRSWPNTITVVVTPREPAIALTVPQEPVRVADAEGTVFDDDSDGDLVIPDDLPSIRVPGANTDPDRVVGAIAMMSALPQDWQGDVSSARLTSDGTLRFDLGDLRIEWGLAGQDGAKVRVLQALLQQEEIDVDRGEDAPRITINVSAPSAPVVEGLPEAPPQD